MYILKNGLEAIKQEEEILKNKKRQTISSKQELKDIINNAYIFNTNTYSVGSQEHRERIEAQLNNHVIIHSTPIDQVIINNLDVEYDINLDDLFLENNNMQIIIMDCTFKNIFFREQKCRRDILFYDCSFGRVYFYDVNFSNSITFDLSTFNQMMEIQRCEFHDEIKFSKQNTFINGLTIKDSIFNKTLTSEVSTFNKLSIENTIFNGTLMFNENFSHNVTIHRTKFNNRVWWECCLFKSTIEFSYTYFYDVFEFYIHPENQNIDFNNIYTNDTTHISLWSSFTYPGILSYKEKPSIDQSINLNIKDSLYKGLLTIAFDSSRSLQNIKFDNVSFSGNVNFLFFNKDQTKIDNWETACILKNEELKRNNFVKALEYQAIEKELLERTKKDELSKYGWKKIFMWLQKKENYSCLLIWTKIVCYLEIKGEYQSLKLGRIFHNHGQNWFLAFLWTIVFGVVPFIVFSLSNPIYLNWSNWCKVYVQVLSSKELWADMILYFVPTEYNLLSEYLKQELPNGFIKFFGILVYFIGKIFVPYGIYEVIKAFRKYR